MRRGIVTVGALTTLMILSNASTTHAQWIWYVNVSASPSPFTPGVDGITINVDSAWDIDSDCHAKYGYHCTPWTVLFEVTGSNGFYYSYSAWAGSGIGSVSAFDPNPGPNSVTYEGRVTVEWDTTNGWMEDTWWQTATVYPNTSGNGWCGEASCTPATSAYISHFTGINCTGVESYYTPYDGYVGRKPWNGTGQTGNQLRTVTNRSYKDSSGQCHNAWPSGNTLSEFVSVYRCGETTCQNPTAKYISHFTSLGCTGTESYYTLYFSNDGSRRPWDGGGSVGTILRTVTNRSYKDVSGQCHDAWPGGNTLHGFVTVYR